MALKRVLTSVDAGWIVAGNMIGAGIFFTPGVVAAQIDGVAWPLLAWLIGGLVSIGGALIYGELGSRIPEAGGDYRYLARAFGPFWGFMNGWAAITLTFSAAAAAQTRAAIAAIPGIGDSSSLNVTLLAPVVVLLLTWTNTVGAKIAGRTTAVLTAVPVAVVIGLFLVGAARGSGEVGFAGYSATGTPSPVLFAAALIPIFFAYSGWNAAAYLAGEMKDPTRSLARGLIGGTIGVTLLYVLFNVALFAVVPRELLAGSERPAAEAANRLLSGGGETLLAVTIAIAILGSANVTLMAGSRVYYAIATDGMAPRSFTRTNKAGVPATALWVSGIWSAVLCLLSNVEDLVGWATLAILLLSSMSVASLFVFRHRDPDGAKFRCPGYPFTPLIYLGVSLAVAVSSYFYNPTHALIGLAVIGAGAPIYLIVRRSFGGVEGGSGVRSDRPPPP